jgi:hypothetical protein
MNLKHFMVVWLPNENNVDVTLGEIQNFSSYADAFDCLIEDTNKPINMPKGEQPLRIEVDNYVKELWVVSRKEIQNKAERNGF